MYRILTLGLLSISILSCSGQESNDNYGTRTLIGNCEGCEAVFEFNDRKLNATDTLPDFEDDGTKIKISGTIYEPDGVTPANDVVMYLYHTNQDGIYEPTPDSEGWEKRHGYIRGWVKTNEEGYYEFYTLKPGHYPDRKTPAHIHPIILEPNGKYYWVGSYFFSDDPYLTDEIKNNDKPRCGSDGILQLTDANGDGIMEGKRDLVLGKNISGY
ncbi:intradiol ring-cleavage dioxygenase [Mangrovivirga sp. M17]|uniref:Intradiol ring-cleavage dioxygenase n=1 Tax=Mangrovivirga halotolerans TaxID=2993936 RepID=A0ABT3RMK9_9BACT|nr:intradiol ring-cleavage dioxygenase [Mangrovivirga halotolerans]MCX2742743.1 intradiol ring-cleavage dioxygenase [Mangrovivirga halotolerans]